MQKRICCEGKENKSAAGTGPPGSAGGAGRSIVAFSFYFALLLRADGAVEASWWPHNRALLYANLPWIVAVYLLSFLAGRLYTILWKYAGGA